MATININGQLTLDQTAGIQTSDEVNVDSNGTALSSVGMDADFLTFLNGLGLSAAQLNFAAFVEGSTEAGLVTVSTSPGETVKSLFFSDSAGNDLNGDLVPGVQLLDGSPLYMWSANNGHVVLISTSNVAPAANTIAAAFYIESSDATNTSAKVESITFLPLKHLNPADPNDTVDFSDILNVSAAVVVSNPVGDDIIVVDDAPTIFTTDHNLNLTVDETTLNTDSTVNFAGEFDKHFGTDGIGTDAQYELSTTGGASGLTDTATNESVVLSFNAVTHQVEGKTSGTGDLVFTVSVAANGDVTLDQKRAVVHTNPNDDNDSTTLLSDGLVSLHATITDGDGDPATVALDIGENLLFLDDGPSISSTGTPPTITVDETTLGVGDHKNFLPNFPNAFGADGAGSLAFKLVASVGTINGLSDEVTGSAIALVQADDHTIQGRTVIGDLLAFTISVTDGGEVTFTQARSVFHNDPTSPNDTRALGNTADLVDLVGTITDKDGDHHSATLDITQSFHINDDAPTITQPLDTDPGTAGIQLTDNLGNAVGQHAEGTFGYSLGADGHNAAFYTSGGSDFGDSNPNVAGTQLLTLTGTVDNPQNPGITNVQTSLFTEDANSAVFNWSFHYDKDPITAGVQDGTAGGTLTFDKIAHTYSVAVNDVVDGFSFNVLHTSELQAKAPPGNTGHPELVVTQLQADDPATPAHDGFFVQFTANSNPNGSPFGFNATGDGSPIAGDTTFNNGQQVTSNFEDWVSATQSTNGVAGDTIQKGELLTLRFFGENILGDVDPSAPGGGTEKLVPTADVNGIAIKFDGIGNSEDLIVVLNLIDHDGADNIAGNADDNSTTTKSLFVQNADFYKASTPGGVPAPYNSEFTLDNNDGLVIIEGNDYNVVAGENWSIQGMQIMQSGNGLGGQALNFNGLTNAATPNTTTAWEATDNDVLKITDIGFIQQTTGTIDANLDFAFNVQDGDFDPTAIQHLGIHISNDFIA